MKKDGSLFVLYKYSVFVGLFIFLQVKRTILNNIVLFMHCQLFWECNMAFTYEKAVMVLDLSAISFSQNNMARYYIYLDLTVIYPPQ